MRIHVVAAILVLTVTTAQAAVIERPALGSFQSGIILIRGWKCVNNGPITLTFNGSPHVPAVTGNERGDLVVTCGHANAGWSFLLNANVLPAGSNTMAAYDDGMQFASVTFTVVKVSIEEFLTGATGTATTVFNGYTVTLGWNERSQSFVVQSAVPIGYGG